jgi:fructose-1,6-bisphosphatase/sedoheptulose 1,7-bisphosphatase-like protein
MTRGRHHVPTRPRRWFKNLIDCFGDALKIRVVYKGDQAVSAMITLRHKETLTDKYTGSAPNSTVSAVCNRCTGNRFGTRNALACDISTWDAQTLTKRG